MMTVDQTAERIANYLHRTVPNASSPGVLKYSLVVMMNYAVIAAAVLVVCAMTGHLLQGIAASLASPLLRHFSGGIHLRSPNTCNVLTALLILTAVHVPVTFHYTGMGLTAAAMLLIVLYAPANIKGYSRIKEQHYIWLKLSSLLIAGLNLWLGNSLLASVFFLQALTITPLAQRLVEKYKW